jgi:PAS domain S-box-containing protein
MTKNLRVLILEDHSADAELMTHTLHREGFAVSARRVWTEPAFVDALGGNAIDLILADYSLPSYDGMLALARASAEAPTVPFIFVSGSLGEDLAIEALHHGATDYVLKQRIDRLGPAVRRALREVEEHQHLADAEDRLRDSERRYREIFNATHEAILVYDPAGGQFLDANRGVYEMFGFLPGDLPTFSVPLMSSNVPPYTKIEAAWWIQRALTEGPQVFEWHCRRKTGELFWSELAVRSTSLGGETCVLIVIRDITERRRAEAQTLFQARLLDLAQDAIMVCSLDGRVVYWNVGAGRLYGWPAEEALGRPLGDLLAMESSEFMAAVDHLLKSDQWAGEGRHLTQDHREVVVNTRWSLVRDAEGQPESILVIDTDITETKALEAKFLQAQRLESLGQLAGGIAHDLNNVLQPVLMGVEELCDHTTDPGSLEVLDVMATSARRGAQIVQQVLTFARGRTGERKIVRPASLITEIGSFARGTFPKKISVDLDVAPDIAPIKADSSQIHQVLLNLCVNARDAMPSGGTLTIRGSNALLDDQYASAIPGAAPGLYVVLTVTDTGMGMSTEVLARAFDPFFTTKEPGHGTGLGLSTVHGIVKSHEGFVDVESELGKGTRFSVYLPAARGDGAAEAAEVMPDDLRGHGEGILVADDEDAIRFTMRTTLESSGYRVLVAPDGAEALAIWADHRQEIAAIVTEVMLPVIDGLALIRVIRKLVPDLGMVAIGGLATPSSELASLRVPYLLKPFDRRQLLTILRRTLRRE